MRRIILLEAQGQEGNPGNANCAARDDGCSTPNLWPVSRLRGHRVAPAVAGGRLDRVPGTAVAPVGTATPVLGQFAFAFAPRSGGRGLSEDVMKVICAHDPRKTVGPIGMYHCPVCAEMVLAGMVHPDWSLSSEVPDEEKECPMTEESSPRCPGCGAVLARVLRPAGSLLNEDQFRAVRAGDYVCDICIGTRGNTGLRYYWRAELKTREEG